MYTLFDTYDADDSGAIEITELRRILEDVTAGQKDVTPDITAHGQKDVSCASRPRIQMRRMSKDANARGQKRVSPPPSPPSAEDKAVTTTPTATPTTSPRQSRRARSSKEFFEGACRSSSNETVRVKREMAKASQELLDQSQWWRLKTYYIFPVLEKLRHLDHISRFLFPTVYLIYLLSALSDVNFGIDHWKLLWSKMACYAEQ